MPSARHVNYLVEILIFYASKLEARSNYLCSIGRLDSGIDKNLKIALTYEHLEPYLSIEMARFYRVAARFFIRRFPSQKANDAELILSPEPSSVESDRQERVSEKRASYFESTDSVGLEVESKDSAFLTDLLCVALELILNLDHKTSKSEPSDFFKSFPISYSGA